MGCLPQAAWPERLSEKSGRWALQQIKQWRFTYDWSWWYPSGNRPLQQYLEGFTAGALVMVSSSIRLTAWLQNSKKRAERSERLMGEWVTAIISTWRLSASSSACHGLLIITVITPLPTKPSATKCQRTEAGERGNYWHADASAWCCCADAKYTKELADAKAENDALRDDVAVGRRRLHIKAVWLSVSKPPPPPAWIMQPPPGLAGHRWTGLFHLREADHYAKTISWTQKYINEQCR